MNTANVITLARRLFSAPAAMNVATRLFERTVPKSTAAQELASWREIEELPFDERPAAHRARSERLAKEGQPWTDEDGNRELVLEVFTSWNNSGSPPESSKTNRRHVSARFDPRGIRMIQMANARDYCTRDLLAVRLSDELAALLAEEIAGPERERAERERIEAEKRVQWEREEAERLKQVSIAHAQELAEHEKGKHE